MLAALGFAVLLSAAGLAAGPAAASIRSAGELGRAREAAAVLSRLHALLSSLPSPPPRCAAACLADGAAAPLGAGEETRRLADALAAVSGQPAEQERAARLGDLIRTALEPAGPRGDGAESLLAEMEVEAQARLDRAGRELQSSLPWGLGGGAAGLALGLLSLGAAVRQAGLRRRAEEGKATMWRAAEQVRDLVTVVDGKGRIVYVNPAVEAVTGYSRDDLVGTRSASWFPWYAGVPFLEEMQRTVLSGRPYRGGVPGRRKTGEEFLAEETVTPLTGPGGS